MSLTFTAKIRPIESSSNLKAFASLIINDTIEINGWRIVDGQYGLFVSAPQKKATKPNDDGSYSYFDDIRFLEEKDEEEKRGPIATEAFNTILEAYKAETGGGAESSRQDSAKAHSRRGGAQSW